MTETEGVQGKEMQLNETQYVAAGVDSVAHRHQLVCVKHCLVHI